LTPPSSDDWFLDEEFWAATFPFMFPPSSFADAAEHVGDLLALADLAFGSVLDLACGPGRFSVPLAQRGFLVTGVDSTGFLLDKARAFAASVPVHVEWVQEDMRNFVRPGAFDLAINLFTSFGYFDSPRENQSVLENVAASLKPGGVLVLDVMGKEIVASIFQPTRSREIPGEGILVYRCLGIEDWSRIENEWLLISGRGVRTFRLRHWLYAGAELRDLLLSSGFSAVELKGSFKGAAYGPGAERLIAVARKSTQPDRPPEAE
jgi:SAM-dependent methyltransferase